MISHKVIVLNPASYHTSQANKMTSVRKSLSLQKRKSSFLNSSKNSNTCQDEQPFPFNLDAKRDTENKISLGYPEPLCQHNKPTFNIGREEMKFNSNFMPNMSESSEPDLDEQNKALSGSNTYQYHQSRQGDCEGKEPPVQKSQKRTAGCGQDAPITNSMIALNAQQTQLQRTVKKANLEFNYSEFLSMTHEPSFTVDKKGYIEIEVTTKKIPKAVNNIKYDNVKNYLKNLGDFFQDYLVKNRVVGEGQLRKNCLDSKKKWNSFLKLERYECKLKKSKTFNTQITELREHIAPRYLLVLFLNFDPELDLYRTSQAIESEKIRRLYELLSRNLKKALEILRERLQSVGIDSKDISDFEIKKLYKSKLIFCFKVDSAIRILSMVRGLNAFTATDINSEKLIRESSDASLAIKHNMIEIEEKEEMFNFHSESSNRDHPQSFNLNKAEDEEGLCVQIFPVEEAKFSYLDPTSPDRSEDDWNKGYAELCHSSNFFYYDYLEWAKNIS